jgi:hypothetical protein
MSEIKLKENEKRAIFRLKEALKERYALLDLRLFDKAYVQKEG